MLKAKVLLSFLFVAISCVLFSFSDPYSVKRISDKDFRYEFYTVSKKIKPKKDKIYYWFKGGVIHNAQSGVSGELLNGDFIKMYHSNQLAEQGRFKDGLRAGLWKTWHENGNLSTVQIWKSGFRSGNFTSFDSNGQVMEKGKFENDKKEGSWINVINKDTTIFKNGVVFVKKKEISKEEKLQLKEEKKRLRALNKEKKSSAKKATKDTANIGFIKKLFSKKNKGNKDGKGA